MQIVKASCPICGDISVIPGDITVTTNAGSTEDPTYTFSCPACGDNVTKPAGAEVRRLLGMVTGVRWNVVRVPAELDEAHYAGPALTESDVQDFVIDMNLTPDHLFSILAGGGK